MNIAEIEMKLKALSEQPFDPAAFPYRVLEIYDAPRATVTKLQNGSMNKGEAEGDVLWKGKLFFRPAPKGKAAVTIDAMKASAAAAANKPRFLMSADGAEISGLDTKSDETFHARFSDFNEQFDFLLPLTGVERYQAVKENPADIKAAGRLAKFYDALIERNPDWKKPERTHALNLFMTRVLFCMFAEDTGIVEKDLFTKTVDEFTLEDGSDTHNVLKAIFDVMDRKDGDREGFPAFAKDFPYVNGGLFRDRTPIPEFSKKSRRVLIEAAQLNWSQINPDIFGSMIQAVVHPELRGDLGMHYTSVPNIMKLIGPLFLDRLEREFEAGKNSAKRLERLLTRIYRIRVFDPACGSGNFLIISYRELRRLEIRIFKRLQEISTQATLPMSQVRLGQFYGIEYADFAAETAKLSLWISEYQANKEFEEVFGSAPPALPLKDGGNISQGNALRLNWFAVCPPQDDAETYIVGNPPYLGRAQQTAEQKADMVMVFNGVSEKFRNMDYVSCWMIKARDYAARLRGVEFSFVMTNSICQGDHVGLLWPLVLESGLEISFAHESFKWKNSASSNAGVTCVIVGLRLVSDEPKYLFGEGVFRQVNNINPYLVEAENIIVKSSSTSLAGLPRMNFGNMSNDGGHLIFSPDEKAKVVAEHPEAAAFFRRIYGSQEYIKGIERWCLWLDSASLEAAKRVPEIARRLELVTAYRSASAREATKAFAASPHLFTENRYQPGEAFFVPQISSERRAYLPCGFLPKDALVIAPHFVIYDCPAYVMALISSRLHTLWITAVCGQLETRIRYSNTLGYNTFPVPALSDGQKRTLDDCTWKIVEERESNPGTPISDLYDPKTMPKALLKAHQDLDATLETIYRGRPFKSDTERLEHLFRLYATKAAAAGKGRAA